MFSRTIKLAIAAVAFAVLGAMSSPASAVPITGSVSFAGGIQPGTDLATTTSIDFAGGSPYGLVSVTFPGGAGDFSILPFNTLGQIRDFSFAPFAAVSNFLMFGPGGISFDLNSITSIVRGSNSSGKTLTLSGTGIFHMLGRDDTLGQINLAMQDIGGQGVTLAFSASAGTVPEPASAALLGSALLGLGLLRRRKSAKR